MIKVLYPVLFIIFFILSMYLFKVLVAKRRLSKMEISIENHGNFHFILPVLSVYFISQIYLKKKNGELKTTISTKKMFFRFNETMDLISILIVVLIEEENINPFKKNYKSIIEQIKEGLTTFLNSGSYKFA